MQKRYSILYSFRRCPYAMRARMALMRAAVTCELREVVLRNKPAAMLALSPKATVPVLHLEDNSVLDESLDIMRWALNERDPDAWLESDDHQGAALIQRLDGEFKADLDHYKYSVNYPEHPQQYYRTQACRFLQALEEMLLICKGRGLLRDRTTFVDISAFPFVRQFAQVDRAWFEGTTYTLLKRWLAAHEASPLYQSVMQKYPAWKPDELAPLFAAPAAAA
jgi:glutathione S-transferase